MNIETWKEHTAHDCRKRPLVKLPAFEFSPGYFVTQEGRVYSVGPIKRGRPKLVRELNAKPNSWGYMRVRVGTGEARESFFVAKLVASAWLPPRQDGQQLRHLNGDKSDNHLANLAWGTAKENAADRDRHGRTQKGARHWKSHLTREQVDQIRVRVAAGEMHREVAEDFGLHHQSISNIVNGKTWK